MRSFTYLVAVLICLIGTSQGEAIEYKKSTSKITGESSTSITISSSTSIGDPLEDKSLVVGPLAQRADGRPSIFRTCADGRPGQSARSVLSVGSCAHTESRQATKRRSNVAVRSGISADRSVVSPRSSARLYSSTCSSS